MNGVSKRCQSFACFCNTGGADGVDYPLGDPTSHYNSISDFSMGDKQPDSDPCPSFKISHSVRLRLPTLSSQGEVLHLNPKKANQYVLIIKHEFTYTHCNTRTSLDKHVRAWYADITPNSTDIRQETRWQTKRYIGQHLV